MNQNEQDHRYDFEVFSSYDREAKRLSKKYKYTKFYYSKLAKLIRIYTNVCFKLHLPVDLSAIPIAPELSKIFRKNKYDAVYVSGYIRGVLTIAKINAERSPVYYHHHVITDIYGEKSLKGRDIFEACEKIAFVSEYGCQKAKTGIPEYDAKICLFRNCINVAKFQLCDKKQIRNLTRKKYDIAENEIVLVFVGRFVANKGVLQLLKAVREVVAIHSKVKLLLVGGATYSSNIATKYVNECLEIVENIKEHVVLPGYVQNDELPQILAAADIGCVPSVCEEACGLTALEMMASGLPLITTNAGGLKEYVPEGCKLVSEWHVGMLPNDIIPGLVKAICELVKDKEKRLEYGEAGKDYAWKFDKNNYLNMFDSFLND